MDQITAFLFALLLVGQLYSFPEKYVQKEIQFQFESDTISGVLILPQEKMNNTQTLHWSYLCTVTVLRPGYAFGYYKPIWNELTKRGIACLSLDKKGVGQSTGNWLDQSMNDRAKEIIAAIEYAKSDLGFNNSAIGLIGFSQGGWVMPKVATLSDYPDFIISISGAINWKRQSNYLTRKRMELEGANEAIIEAGVRQIKLILIFLIMMSFILNMYRTRKKDVKMKKKRIVTL